MVAYSDFWRLNLTEKLPLFIGENDKMCWASMLVVAQSGNLIFNMPLAPVMMVAVRVPDVANSIMACHACSSVN